MPFSELKKFVEKFYGPALALRAMSPDDKRHVLYQNLIVGTIFVFILTLTAYAVETTSLGSIPGLSIATLLADRLWGLFLLTLSVTFFFAAAEALHRSYYFKGLKQVLSETTDLKHAPVDWEVATIVDETLDSDVTAGYLNSVYGQEILYRVGISAEVFKKFDDSRKPTLQADGFIIDRDKGVLLSTYTRSIYKQDEDFRHFLSENNISEEQLVRAAEWTTSIEVKDRKIKRWWSRDNLGRIPGIGKSWSYGATYLLEKYGHDISEDHIWQSALMTRKEEDDEVEDIEQVLSRSRQSNVLLLTNDVLTARQRTAQLYHKIREGVALPPIEAKRIFFIDIESILMANEDKAAFETLLRDVFIQAVNAGNIILYFENLSTVTASAHTIGVDVVDTISSFFESSEIQIVVGELSENFNKYISRDTRVTQAFDVLEMRDVGQDGLQDLLEQRAFTIEHNTKIVFTVPALQKIGELADRYFPTGVMPDKAFDLIEELVPYAFSNGIMQVLRSDIEDFVTKKTRVPVGEPTSEERDKLLKLEEFLHERVVAQEEAVSSVAKALRRSRAGVANPKKPMGTFLFLGPTGVGKTETAKALAEIMFGDEDAMIRLDMSEFHTVDAVNELIGTFETGKPGRLEDLLRKKMYGVLLLDEFEKSHRDVHDLFLQILDEGHFTDAMGRNVNLRNHIIIATSNAGADLIWQWEKEGKKIEDSKKALVDHIIAQNLYRPELLNRFDDIIVFHALTQPQVTEIARIHLENFAKRIEYEQNIKVHVTDELISYVASKGYDPKFGGRPLERAIMSEVEQIIADEMLAGKLHSGDTFEFKGKNN
jgi:ATP-dependent Clp protease ATP-binding subunit ClpC